MSHIFKESKRIGQDKYQVSLSSNDLYQNI